MGLQKYRADIAGEPCANGAVPHYTRWIGGPTLALVRNCPTENRAIEPRTVYVRGEPDTWFSVPAACRYKRRTVRGYLTMSDGSYVFRAHDGELEEKRPAASE
jgi:hypothetical protein